MKTVEQFAKELLALKPSLREMEIKIVCPNGLEVEPKIRQGVKEGKHIMIDKDAVNRVVLHWD